MEQKEMFANKSLNGFVFPRNSYRFLSHFWKQAKREKLKQKRAITKEINF